MVKWPRRLGHGEEATLVEHLEELRSRLIVALLALGVAFGVAYGFHDHLIEWLKQPLPRNRRDNLITIGVTEPFFTSIRVSLYAALVGAMPVMLWQLWSFLAPALEQTRQRVVVVFSLVASVLFAGGVVFSYYVILPPALDFLTNFNSDEFNIQIRAASYFSFVSAVLLAIGVVFQLPVFVLTLVRLGIVSSATLRRQRRIGYFLAITVAVLLPTVDPVSLAFETIPLVVLFEASIWLSVYFEKRWWPTPAVREEPV